MRDLRGHLSGAKAEIHVVPNALLGVAARGLGWGDMSQFLVGPTAMVSGAGDVSQVAKLLTAYVRDNNLPIAIKGGRLASQMLGAKDVVSLAELPPREILLGRVVGTIAAPMSRLVGVMNQKVASLLYVLKAVAEKKASAEKK
jgi:large subunit ribosomal protein L10